MTHAQIEDTISLSPKNKQICATVYSVIVSHQIIQFNFKEPGNDNDDAHPLFASWWESRKLCCLAPGK